MSDNALTDNRAIRELEVLVHHLADELAGFRRRALVSEARLKDLEGHDEPARHADLTARVTQLERDNDQLQIKLESAGARARLMLERVRFLRQQAQAGDP